MTKRAALSAAVVLLAVPAAARSQAGPSPGRPSSAALTSALGKQDAMRRPNGPTFVTLSAEEMASLVQNGLDPRARSALDSISVFLNPGRLTLRGYLVTSTLGVEVLGPMALMLDPRERVSVSGPAHAAAPGLIAWEPDSFMVRNFSVPPGAIPQLVNRLVGTTNGAIPIAVPPTVLRVQIDADAVTFSRR